MCKACSSRASGALHHSEYRAHSDIERAFAEACDLHAEGMDFLIEKRQDVAVLALPFEELDAGNAADFKRGVTPILEAHPKLVFDLTRLRFIDSSGLGAFISCLRKVNAHGGDLKLCGLSKAVRAVFELVRMQRIFDIHPTPESAARAFGTSVPEV